MYWHKTPLFVQWLYPNLTWHRSRNSKELYLTFDDGPIPEITPEVLNILRTRDVKATFFCVGDNVSKHADIYKQVLEEGHKSGNHTYNHLNGWKTPVDTYLENVTQCDKIVPEAKFFRPAYGKMKRAAINPIKNKYEIIMWDVLAGDFDQNLDKNDCLDNTINATQNGSIIIFHDSLKAQNNLFYALPRYIDHFLNLGYQFRTL